MDSMTERKTVLSEDRQYRYALWREWGGADVDRSFVLFVLLNPSTADETADDPTLRRCIGFTKAWGFNSLCVANLFAYRATDPKAMKDAADPVGPDNDEWLRKLSREASIVVAGWGVNGSFQDRDIHVNTEILGETECFGTTRDDMPRHPLYMAADTQLVMYR